MKTETFNIVISLDGNMWCALIGENLQEGVVGFGDTPKEALVALLHESSFNALNTTYTPASIAFLSGTHIKGTNK